MKGGMAIPNTTSLDPGSYAIQPPQQNERLDPPNDGFSSSVHLLLEGAIIFRCCISLLVGVSPK